MWVGTGRRREGACSCGFVVVCVAGCNRYYRYPNLNFAERAATRARGAASETAAMPTFVLKAKAELDGVSKFWVPPTHVWTLDVKQSTSDEVRSGVTVDPEEEVEVPNTKNTTANLVLKFDGDKSASYLKIVDVKGLNVRPQTDEDTEMVPLVAFECRGLEPVRWTPIGPYSAEAPSGVVYEVAFQENDDWCEYDEKSGESLSVGWEIAHEFVRHKDK